MFELHEAVRQGNVNEIISILQRDSSKVNNYDLNLRTPLDHLYDRVYDENPVPTDGGEFAVIINIFVDYGADLNLGSGETNEPIIFQTIYNRKYNCISLFKLLLEKGADPNARNYVGNTVLHNIACDYSKIDEEYFSLLLKHGFDVKAVNMYQKGPLDYAIINFFWNFAEFLIKEGFVSKNIYALIDTLLENDEEIEESIAFIIENGTNIDCNKKFTSQHLLIYLTQKNLHSDLESECFEILNLYGINTSVSARRCLQDSINEKNNTILENALKSTSADEVNVTNSYGDTSLHILFGLKEISDEDRFSKLEILLNKGADLSLKNDFGFTPFNVAVKNLDINVVYRILMKITGFTEIYQNCFESIDTEDLRIIQSRISYWYYVNVDEFLVATLLKPIDIVNRLIELNYHQTNGIKYSSILMDNMRKRHCYDIIQLLIETGLCKKWKYYKDSLQSESTIPVMCLFIEYSKIPDFMDLIIQEIENIPLYNNTVVYLLTYFYAIKLQTNYADVSTLLDVFTNHETLSKIFPACNEKLKKLKKETFSNGMTVYDILSKKLSSIIVYLGDKDNFEALKKFSLYETKNKEDLDSYNYIIKTRLSLALKRRKLLDLAKVNLNNAWSDLLCSINFIKLPDHIMENILAFLSDWDLKKIAMC